MMDVVSILALVSKGVMVADALIQAGKNAGPAITALMKLIGGNRDTPPTQAEMDEAEAVLDSLIDEFNVELPPE